MELRDQLEKTIVSNLRHKHYDKVTKLAEMYEAFIMNDPVIDKDGNETTPLNKYLRQFVRREDKELFEQRKNITKQYVPSICAQIMRPFTKVVRSNRVIKLIDHKDKSVVDGLEDSLKKFYGESDNSGVDQFLSERFLPLTFTDPNAWIWVSFEEFNGDFEKPQTFPVEYSSKTVINYSLSHDYTEWVIVKLLYTYINDSDKEKTAERFIIFGENEAYEYKLIPDDIKETFVKEGDETWVNPKDKKEYWVKKYQHNSERVPLMRVGYRRDLATKSETFVNPFHYEAMPLLMQFVKLSSELQLSITLHAFPKEIGYVEPCENKGCANGLMFDGTECEVCKGSGKKHHTTAADIIEVPTPKDPSQMVDVSKLAAYIPFPGGVLEFLDNYADKTEKKIIRMVFSTESLVQTQFHKTATEAQNDFESIYDTLHPFADKYSELWMFFVRMTALYRSDKEVTVIHKFNSDYKFKPLNQLLTDLKTANDSNAPSYIRESINNDIADIIYADNQTELAKLRIKNKHYPFPGKTDFEIQNIILNNLAPKFKQVLYANFDNIFDEIEIDNKGFYDMAYKKQKEIVMAKVNEIMDELAPTLPPKPNFEKTDV